MQSKKSQIFFITLGFLIVIGIVGFNVVVEKNIYDFGYLIVLIVYLIRYEIVQFKS